MKSKKLLNEIIYEYSTFIKRCRKKEVLSFLSSSGVLMHPKSFLYLFSPYECLIKKGINTSILTCDYSDIIFFTEVNNYIIKAAGIIESDKFYINETLKNYFNIDRSKHIVCIAQEFLIFMEKKDILNSYCDYGIDVKTHFLFNNFFPNIDSYTHTENGKKIITHEASYRKVRFYSTENIKEV